MQGEGEGEKCESSSVYSGDDNDMNSWSQHGQRQGRRQIVGQGQEWKNDGDRLYQSSMESISSSPSSSSSSSSSLLLTNCHSQTKTKTETETESGSEGEKNTTNNNDNNSIKEEEITVYSSESEMISALSSASTDPLYSDTYQRCCKVLIKIANLTQAKHFFWEVDSVMYPDYYSSINKPVMIANVTSNLIRQSYGDNGLIVGDLFYKDMRQIVLNCFAYNTEVTAVNAQAQKLYQVSLSPSLPLCLSLSP